MSYAGMYEDTPRPEPKPKPRMAVDLNCGETVMADPWWMSDPLYGGWKTPAFAWCPEHSKTESVKSQTWPPHFEG